MTERTTCGEPDYATACGWWPDLPNIWTPVGWKDHLFRFNVMWNGTILAQPHLNRRTAGWEGQGVQLAIRPNVQEWKKQWSSMPPTFDDGMVTQGWQRDDAPILWTEWSHDGLLSRSSVFAHIPGGGDVRTGDDPLFAWIRLDVHYLCEGLPLEESSGFNLLLCGTRIAASMSLRDNIRIPPDYKPYARPLRAEPRAFRRSGVCRILEADGTVRLAVAPGGDCTHARFIPVGDDQPCAVLHVRVPARRKAHVDLLLPMVPMARGVLDRELRLGYEGALAETRRYWRKLLACRTHVEVPEPAVNDATFQSVRISHLLSEKNPATGKYCKINGSWHYANLWTTPGAMDLAMMMDTLGYHRTVERYLDIFLAEQGTVTPPGDAYERHPGYFSTPELYKSVDWLSDNGAVLYTLCTHALLSGDPAFRDRVAGHVVRSCEWIRHFRMRRGHGGYEGVLPAAVATDRGTRIQALWSDGWNYKGLCAAVRLLKQMGHPRAAEFASEARAYKAAFAAALRDKCRQMPVWKDARGRKHVLVPTALSGESRAETRHAFYLDTGPLFLVFAGLLEADDPLMAGVRLWFREGPPWTLYRRDSNCWQVPVLDHEMSSCEPCYSWNIFHSWQLGDRARFLEGMYSLFAGSLSRKTGVSCETRGGITGTVFSAPLAIRMARLAVIDDEIRDDELHLLRLMPLAWLRPGDACRFDAVPTLYGPVTLRTRRSRDGGTLEVTFRSEFHHAPRRMWLHVPPAPGLRRVVINGRSCSTTRSRHALPDAVGGAVRARKGR